MSAYPHTEYTFPNACCRMPFLHGSFGPDAYEEAAREAIKCGAIMVRNIDADGTELYRLTVRDAQRT